MSATSVAVSAGSSKAARAILLGGAVAGVLDITYAIVANGLRGRGPVWVLQTVASGLLGQAAFDGGLATGALGLVLHFFIATSAAAVYYAASRKLAALVDRAWIWGPAYGVAVYLFMNFVVIPLSAFPFTLKHPPLALAIGIAGHMLLVGLPIALAARRYSK